MRMTGFLLVAVIVLMAPFRVLANGTHGAQLNMVGPEFRVNIMTAGDQYPLAVTVAEDGSFEIVYHSMTGLTGTETRATVIQHFDAEGDPVGTPELWTSYIDPRSQAVATDGTTVVVWNIPFNGIYAQLFDAQGAAITEQFLVQPCVEKNIRRWVGMPKVAIADDGTFVVVWHATEGVRIVDGVIRGVDRREANGVKSLSLTTSPPSAKLTAWPARFGSSMKALSIM